MEVNDPETGRVIAKRYRLLGLLGSGAMGAVYRAEDTRGEIEGHVAIKLMNALGQGPRAEQAQARFFREAESGGAIMSENVVQVMDYGVEEEQEQPFMVMGLLDGFDLEDAIREHGPLPVETAVRIICQAAQGIEAAHSMGVIHRDLKPSNIFLHREPSGSVRVKVCDFGIAKAFAKKEALTATGSILGSPLFMAPEQVMDSKRVNPTTDVWGLAVTLYTALAGRAPLQDTKDITRVMMRLTMEPVPSIQDVAPWVSGDLAEVIHGALLQDVNKRCPDVGTLRLALEDFTGGSTELSGEMLRPLTNEERGEEETALRDRPTDWREVSSDMMALGDTLASDIQSTIIEPPKPASHDEGEQQQTQTDRRPTTEFATMPASRRGFPLVALVVALAVAVVVMVVLLVT